jgi:hypothetical protein
MEDVNRLININVIFPSIFRSLLVLIFSSINT